MLTKRNAGVSSPEATFATLFLTGLNAPVSLVYLSSVGLVVVGLANGVVKLVVPEANAYRYLTLRTRGPEAPRSAYIDPESGSLIVTLGDRNVLMWDLRNLEVSQTGVDDGEEVVSEKFSFDRVHSFNTCRNAFLFQGGLKCLLIIRKAVNLYEMDFAPLLQMRKNATLLSNGNTASEESEELMQKKEIAPFAFASTETTEDSPRPKSNEHAINVSASELPCFFDRNYLVSVHAEKAGKFLINIRDWNSSDKRLIRSIPLNGSILNKLTPKSVQVFGDFLSAIWMFRQVLIWRISTGELVYKLYNSGHGPRIIALRLVKSRQVHTSTSNSDDVEHCRTDPGTFHAVTLGQSGRINLWHTGVIVQSLQIPKRMSNFFLGGPYFLEPELTKPNDIDSEAPKLKRVYFSDDTGVHVVAPI